jgi:hypothetical protein
MRRRSKTEVEQETRRRLEKLRQKIGLRKSIWDAMIDETCIAGSSLLVDKTSAVELIGGWVLIGVYAHRSTPKRRGRKTGSKTRRLAEPTKDALRQRRRRAKIEEQNSPPPGTIWTLLWNAATASERERYLQDPPWLKAP